MYQYVKNSTGTRVHVYVYFPPVLRASLASLQRCCYRYYLCTCTLLHTETPQSLTPTSVSTWSLRVEYLYPRKS